MSDHPQTRILNAIESVTGKPAKSDSNGWTTCCPAHEDASPSLSIGQGDDGRVLLRCHSGCTTDAILDAIGLTAADLFAPKLHTNGRSKGNLTPYKVSTRSKPKKPKRTHKTIEAAAKGATAFWQYCADDAEWTPIMWVAKYKKPDGRKTYLPFHPTDAGIVCGDPPGSLPLYHLPELVASKGTVYVCEGEKACDAARSIGLTATASAHGSESAKKTDWTPLGGRDVVILPDDDKPGRAYADSVATTLVALDPPATVRIVELPGLPDHGDIVEYVKAHEDADRTNTADVVHGIEALAKAAPEFVQTVDADGPPTSIYDDAADATPSADVGGEAYHWPDIVPIEHFNPPGFPIDALSNELCALCARISESIQVPVDLPAMLVLAAGATCFAKRLIVAMDDGWTEPTNMYVCVALPPGERKSRVFRLVFEPIQNCEREALRDLAEAIDKIENDRVVIDNRLTKARRDAAQAPNAEKRQDAKRDTVMLMRELRECPAVSAPQYIAEDVTPERLVGLLQNQHGRIALLSPEGDVFGDIAGRYSKESKLGVYLKGHCGDPIRTDRVNKDRPPEHVEDPAITIGLAVQPDVVSGLANHPGFVGRGLLARFLFSLPKSKVGYREVKPGPIPESTIREYHDLIETAMRYSHPDDLATEVPTSTVRLSTEADATMRKFMATVEVGLRQGGELSLMSNWGGKLVGAVCRIAAILHGFAHVRQGDPAEHPIDVETMRSAIRIGEYLIEHARGAFALMGADPDLVRARKLVGWIAEKRLTEFSRRDAYHCVRSQSETVDVVESPLLLLQEHGYIRPVWSVIDPSKPGRKPSPVYEVNHEIRAHNAQNSEAG